MAANKSTFDIKEAALKSTPAVFAGLVAIVLVLVKLGITGGGFLSKIVEYLQALGR